MERYEAYKDSGVEWIGEIPQGWEARRIKTAVKRKGEAGHPDETVLSLYRDYGVVVKDSRDDNFNRTSENTEAYRFVEVDDLVVNKMKAWQGSLAVSGYRGIVSPAYYVYRIIDDSVFPRYMHYQLRDSSYLPEYRRLSGGIRPAQWDLSSDNFVNIPMLVPPLAEQERIADYLDAKTAEIDALVADCEQEVELLQEYRKAVISEAVTKGLNPAAPMKDSDIEWIGEIPKEWDLQEVQRFANVVRGASPRPAGDPELFDGDFMPWITVAEVTNCIGKYICNTSMYLTELGSRQSRIIENGTLLLSNSGATLGVPRISKIRGCINDGSVAFLDVDADLEFLYYALSSMTDRLREMVKYGGQPNLNTDIVKTILIAMPPQSEQQAIADYLDAKTAEIDSLIDAKQTMADKLREYRRSLISEGVTGKFKVPGVK